MSKPHDLQWRGCIPPRQQGQDLAPLIAAHLVEARIMPCCTHRAYWITAWKWPEATPEEMFRGYEIAVEIWEDDYLFDQQA